MEKRKKGFLGRYGEIVKDGAVAGVVLYPASKLVWATDSMAKNMLPVGMPSYARTPIVTLALGAVAAMLPSHYLTEKIGEMVLAAGVVQTVQQYGQTTAGQPGTIDAAVNKVFQPIANVGMAGYTTRLRGYIEQRKMAGYTEMGATRPVPGTRFASPRPIHPNDQVRGRMRGFQAEHFTR